MEDKSKPQTLKELLDSADCLDGAGVNQFIQEVRRFHKCIKVINRELSSLQFRCKAHSTTQCAFRISFSRVASEEDQWKLNRSECSLACGVADAEGLIVLVLKQIVEEEREIKQFLLEEKGRLQLSPRILVAQYYRGRQNPLEARSGLSIDTQPHEWKLVRRKIKKAFDNLINRLKKEIAGERGEPAPKKQIDSSKEEEQRQQWPELVQQPETCVSQLWEQSNSLMDYLTK